MNLWARITLVTSTAFALCIVISLYIHPFIPNSAITRASLTEFSVTNNTTLHYNLALNISLRNRNKYYRTYYDNIELTASYKNQAFGTVNLNSFYQGVKNTTVLTLSFKGHQHGLVNLSNVTFTAGTHYHIAVKLYLQNVFLVSPTTTWFMGSPQSRSEFTCHLQVPLVNYIDGEASNITTKCDSDFSIFL
ncbi:NDR1/HIN1-like protein 3 [Prunus avium]|uniref:NDR1/HIN1-like protein 3 n=1 Tax=Prunus avium TaxID=42229 RepID=A0A6P5SXK4_PRUAV|nr:NDR1/HIN1-like protein 3 [Prunus avium]